LGVNALVLAGTAAAIARQRRFFLAESFAVTWLGFIPVVAAAAAAAALLLLVLEGRFPQPAAALSSVALTWALFPPAAWLFARLQRHIARPA
jgi:hypothetical protein